MFYTAREYDLDKAESMIRKVSTLSSSFWL